MSKYDNNTRRFPAAFGGKKPFPYRKPSPPTEQKVEEKKVDLTSEMNFPSLGGNDAWNMRTKDAPGTSGKSFASLASSWKEADDEEQKRVEFERMKAEREAEERRTFAHVHRFNTRSYLQPTTSKLFGGDHEEDVGEEEYEENRTYKATDSDWNIVDRSATTRVSYVPRYAYDNHYDEDEDEEY